MQLALQLARRGEGRTAPNPPVGAVIVQHETVVGEGFHPRAGEPHAEIFALQQAGNQSLGADIYVTLEPCSHHGRTGPCAEALIRAGIRRVIVGVQDPNPQVAGRGLEMLRQAGIVVIADIEKTDCSRLIAPFSRHISSGLPFTIYKTAMTLDGKTATVAGDSQWISGEQSRLLVHQLRNRVEAIMVGIGTVLKDDPLLNTRLAGGQGRDPLRVIVDSQLRMPLDSALLHQASNADTLIATACDNVDRIAALQKQGAEVLLLPAPGGQVALLELWQELGRRNVQRLLLEGGATLAGAALNADLIDQLMVFIAPKIIGGTVKYSIFSGEGCLKLADAVPLADIQQQQVGEDILITGDVVRCSQD